MLFSGYLPEYVYALGGLDGRYSLAELRALGRITERAKQAGDSEHFSAAIRAGIPELGGWLDFKRCSLRGKEELMLLDVSCRTRTILVHKNAV